MPPMREPYLVIGSKGMLGSDLVQLLGRSGIETLAMDIDEVDITKLDSVRAALLASKPGTVINVAAFTDVDGCESAPDKAFEANAQGPAHLAAVCSELESALVHISTDYVFDGLKRGAYREDDPIDPLGVYGKSKAQGEKFVRDMLPDNHCIVRTEWLFGLNGKNFVATMLDLGRTREVLAVVDDQRGSPTYTPDLAAALVRLCRHGGRGTFHVTNSGDTTWHGFAKRIFAKAGMTSVRVDPITTEQLGRPAPRPQNSVMDNGRFSDLTGGVLRHWEEALDDYLRACGVVLPLGER
jgi:dTDP-4-dehydrorhamnose reductase